MVGNEAAVNGTIKELMERKSLRAFDPKPVGAGEKETILMAAMAAPSAGNQQLYTILDIVDEALKAKLACSCDDQPFIAKASMVLVFCADVQRWYDSYIEAGISPRLPGPGVVTAEVSHAYLPS